MLSERGGMALRLSRERILTTRRTFLVAGLCVIAAPIVAPARAALAQTSLATPAYVFGATAVTEVFGDGQRLVAVALEHDRAVDAAALDPAHYAVEGRTITRVYASASPRPGAERADGRYVLIELSPDDAAARLIVLKGPSATRLPAATTVTLTPQSKAAAPANAPKEGPPDFSTLPQFVPTDAALNLVVDDFKQAEFQDAETGDTLAYNLFVPRDRDPAAPLPLVVFMHDAGNTSTVVDTTLVQGLGAVSWASPEDQARNPAIVLAPQYASQIVNDASEATSLLDTTLHLIDRIASEQNVDRNRIYLTGQSGGGMMSIAMLIREPERFAAAFLVACQWDPTVVAPLAKQKLWVMVSEGDAKAFPGQNAIMKGIEGAGTKVSRAIWSGESSPGQFAALVVKQESEGTPIQYTVLEKGTVVPAGQPDDPGMNHVNTWRIAYTIPGIRAWILDQKR